MRRSPRTRALAGAALLALALGGMQPAGAQVTQPGQPTTTQPAPSVAPVATPRPIATASAAPVGGTTSTNRNQTPSVLPGAAGTPPPGGSTGGGSGAPGAPANTSPTGGSAVIDAARIPTLVPADQRSPLPYPAYGTPAPVAVGRTTAAGVPQVVTLQQAVLIAYARSPLLASARADVAIATAPVSLAQSAIFPNVAGVASTTRNHRESSGTTVNSGTNTGNGSNTGTGTGGTGTGTGTNTGTGTGTTTTTTTVNTFTPTTTTNSLSLQVQQLIYDGGRVAAQIRQARANQSASISTYQRELQTVAFNVATAYYNALAAQRQTQVGLTTVQLDQVQENLVLAQIRAGTAARTDLATAQLPTAQARVSVIRAQATELNQLSVLSNTLGLDADVTVQPKDDVPALSATNGTVALTPNFPTPSYQTAFTRAIALRPDLAAAQLSIVSNQEAVKAARLGNFPNLNASASYGTASSDASGGAFRNSSSIGASLSIPFYDRGITRAQTAQAQGQLDRAVAQQQIAVQGVQLGVRQALVNLVSAYAALGQTNAELVKAQEVLRATQAQYRAGVTTLPLLLNAQVGLTQALTDEVTTVYTVRQAEQALLYAEGANAAG